MDITVTITNDHRFTALQAALAAYNQGNPPLTEAQFVQKLIDGAVDGFVGAYLNTRIDVIDFLERFTAAERVAIRTEGKTNPVIDDYLKLLDAAPGGKVNLTGERTIAGVQTLESEGLIGLGRAAEILTL